MKGLLYLVIVLFAVSCTRTVYIPAIRTQIAKETDTLVETQLVPYRDSVVTEDTVSYLANPYAESWAGVINGKLSHSLNIKDSPVTVPGKVYYFFVHDSVGYPVKGDTVYRERVPGWCWWTLGIGVVCLMIFIGKVSKN